MKCEICNCDIPGQSRGRPRQYCSTVCRRVAEMEVRRINALLGKLEARASEARLSAFHTDRDREKLSGEIERQRARLLVLLAGAGEEEKRTP